MKKQKRKKPESTVKTINKMKKKLALRAEVIREYIKETSHFQNKIFRDSKLIAVQNRYIELLESLSAIRPDLIQELQGRLKLLLAELKNKNTNTTNNATQGVKEDST